MSKKILFFLLLLSSICFAYNPSITSFNTGMISSLMEARADFQKYSSSCRTIENMFVTVQGPVIKRPGTKYIATAKSGIPRLIPFINSTDDAYIFEFGDLYFRICRNGGQILNNDDTPYEETTVFDSGDIWDMQYALADNTMYLVDGNDPPQILTRTDHNDWTITDATFESGPFLEENDTTTTIWASGITGSVTLTASSAIFQTTAGASHVGSIWAINQVRESSTIKGTFKANGVSLSTPYFSGNYSFTTEDNADSTITLQRSTNNGISWRAALTALTDTDFDNTAETEEDGAIYRVVCSEYGSGTPDYTFTITDNKNEGVVKITAVASSTSATATVITALIDSSTTTAWREPYWSDYRGWPTTVVFHQQRLIFGGSKSYPQTIWFGKTNPDDYTNFLEGTLDTSAFTVALPGQNPIKWLLSQDYIMIGTSGSCGKWGEQGEAVTVTSPSYIEQTQHGAGTFQAVLGGDTVLYVERGNRNVRELGYSLQADKFVAPPLAILTPEITDSGIKDIAFQLRPDPILWCVLNDGEIATMTYEREQSVIAWTKQITDGDFESVAVISSGDDEDEVWVVVDRDAGTYIEQFQPRDWGTDQDDAWFVDSGLDYDSTATTSFSGLDHLEGETVSVWADGIVLSDEVVASGDITIDVSSERVISGLPFTAKLETLPIRADPADYAMNKKIKRLWIDFYKTGDCKYGNGADSDLQQLYFYDGATLEARYDMFTSDSKLRQFLFPYSGMRKQTVYLQSSKPVPLGVRAIILEMAASN